VRVSELGNRYAKALFSLATENKTQEKVFSDLRALEQVFVQDQEAFQYLNSVTVRPEEKQKVVQKAIAGSGLSTEVTNLLELISKRNRFAIFSELTEAFQTQIDNANGVARGSVRSASVLGPDERQRIEGMVETVLKKKIIMTYKVDPNLIGGLVAQVGSFTFDDTLDSHLRKIHEDLKRRTV
jgi:F-type H+-transporting ATPase subunit delta